MVVIPVPAMNPEHLKDLLFRQFRIEVPVTTHKDQQFIRISIQAYNTPSDADALLAAVKTIYRL
jgi:selenocysteine lyase/cysteine desulfurase